jgi:hypothetical protein
MAVNWMDNDTDGESLAAFPRSHRERERERAPKDIVYGTGMQIEGRRDEDWTQEEAIAKMKSCPEANLKRTPESGEDESSTTYLDALIIVDKLYISGESDTLESKLTEFPAPRMCPRVCVESPNFGNGSRKNTQCKEQMTHDLEAVVSTIQTFDQSILLLLPIHHK